MTDIMHKIHRPCQFDMRLARPRIRASLSNQRRESRAKAAASENLGTVGSYSWRESRIRRALLGYRNVHLVTEAAHAVWLRVSSRFWLNPSPNSISNVDHCPYQYNPSFVMPENEMTEEKSGRGMKGRAVQMH